VKGRSFAIVGWCLLGIWLLAGCAGNQMVSDSFDYTNRPQLLLPGANRAEVKGLAMGAARAKGWSIVQSTDEFMVIQRPLDPASPAATALGAAKSSVPPVIEVRSAFVEQSGGVNVALVASLITQPPGEKAPKRIDYTESYRDALTQSLASLRSNWAANRQRVANAMPDPALATQPAPAATPAGTPPGDNPLVQAWGQTVAETPAAAPGTPVDAEPPPASAPPSAPESRPAAGPVLQWSSPTPAPVADGTGAVTAGYQPALAPVPAPVPRMTQPTPPPTVVLRAPQAARPSIATIKPAAGTAKTAAQAAKVEPKAAKPAVKGAKPDAKVAKTDAKAAKPEPKTAKADTKAAKSGPKTAKVDAKAAKPEPKTAKVDAKAAKPGPKTAKVDAKAAKPEPKTAKTDAKTAKPQPKGAKPDTKQAKPDAKPVRSART